MLPGGNGLAFDWRLLVGRQMLKPWLLAGGLTPENVGRAIRQVRPAGVDAHTGVEASDGSKDPALVGAFVGEARRAFALLERNPFGR